MSDGEVLERLGQMLVSGARGRSLPALSALEPHYTSARAVRGGSEALLDALGLALGRARLGQRLPRPTLLERRAAPLDDRPEPSRAAELMLRDALGYGKAAFEWEDALAQLAQRGLRVPSVCLPGLLDRASVDARLRPALCEVLGVRGRWLVARAPRWAVVLGELPDIDPDVAEVWFREADDETTRVGAYVGLRAHDPARAAALLDASWPSSSAKLKVGLLEAIRAPTSQEEPTLERALGDRAKSVREASARALSRWPGSQLQSRMQARLHELVVGSGADLRLSPPRVLDEAASRDGIVSDPPVPHRDRPRAWAEQMLAVCDPESFERRFSLTPEALLEAAERGRQGASFRLGWSAAAIRHRNARWARALLGAPVPGERELLRLVSPEVREAELRTRWARAKTGEGLTAALELLTSWPYPASARFASEALERLSGVLSGLRAPFPIHGALTRVGRVVEVEGEDAQAFRRRFGIWTDRLVPGTGWRLAAEEAMQIMAARRALVAALDAAP